MHIQDIHRMSVLSFQRHRPDPTPDAEFFYECVFIELSGTLFCVPKEHLDLPEAIFLDMNIDGTPSNNPNVDVGTHVSNPIVLRGVGLNSFRSFLKGAWRRNGIKIVTDDWMNILTLAHEWHFHSLKDEAIKNIETSDTMASVWKRDPYHFIELGRRFDIKEWIVRGYRVLVNPNYSLGGQTLMKQGLGAQMVKLLMIKEAVCQYNRRKHKACFSCGRLPEFRVVCAGPFVDTWVDGRRVSRRFSRDLASKVEYCDCNDAVFVSLRDHNGDWEGAANLLIEHLFREELKACDSGNTK